MTASVFDTRPCELGEGLLWHPIRGQLFWFDIVGKKLMSEGGAEWQFDEHVSAAGWIDQNRMIVASESELFVFNMEKGTSENICPLDATDKTTRSNDGRADPQGGFWIGTMAKDGSPQKGAIYRYYRGELRRLFAPITISNSICFAPSGDIAYFTDTPTRKVMKVALDQDGWPAAPPQLFLDLNEEGLNPDGSVVAADGTFLNAQWGASRVARYSAEGVFVESYPFEAPHISCPCLGGKDLKTLFATSAREGMDDAALAAHESAGMTFSVSTDLEGQKEHQVIL